MPDPNAGAPQGEPIITPPAAPAPDRGFPQETPIAAMSDAERAAYWQHYARKHEDTAKSFGGVTPQQVTDMKTELETLRAEKLSADERTLLAAREDATKSATAELTPRLQAAEVRAVAAEFIKGDQLKSFMSIVNPAAFVGESGQIDEAKVVGALTGMFGAPQTNPAPAQRWQNAGQYSSTPPPSAPGAGGRAEAARLFGTKPPNP